ncbi:MAG TPA: hypothetical protein VFD82_06430 [Planctomycetota bacterium]|nr:hypothetical protein [Planctomycetota bacterium]
MRGGPFSETRVIELLNRRFVPFFFNTGGPGQGKDDKAHDFVTGKVPNRWAYFAAFAPDGRILGQTGIYDGTEQVFAWLRALLRRHPEFDRPTAAETEAREQAAGELTAAAALDVARQCEQLTWYAESKRACERVLGLGDATQRAEAHRVLLRIARADGDWPAHATALAAAAESALAAALATDLAIESGLRMLAEKRFAGARVALESAIASAKDSPRLAELHYEAGRACWFGGDRYWAKAHWCWILAERPDDRMAMRARLAAGAEEFPYLNCELGNFEAKTGPVGPDALDDGVRKAQHTYEQLRERLVANKFELGAAREAAPHEPEVVLARTAPPAIDPVDAPDNLVARLADADAETREKLVEQIAAAGEGAAQPLVVAVGNEAFRGRLAAVVATGKLFAAHPEIGKEPRGWFKRPLAQLARSGDDEIAAAAKAATAAMQTGQ